MNAATPDPDKVLRARKSGDVFVVTDKPEPPGRAGQAWAHFRGRLLDLVVTVAFALVHAPHTVRVLRSRWPRWLRAFLLGPILIAVAVLLSPWRPWAATVAGTLMVAGGVVLVRTSARPRRQHTTAATNALMGQIGMPPTRVTHVYPTLRQIIAQAAAGIAVAAAGLWLLNWTVLPVAALAWWARWWLREPEPPGPDEDAARVFQACAALMGVPLESKQWSTVKNASGRAGRVQDVVPTRVEDHVVIHRGDDHQIASIALTCAASFRPKNRGALHEQLETVLEMPLIADYSAGYNAPVFRAVPPMPTGAELPFGFDHLAGLDWREQPVAVADADTPGARILADGKPWLVVDTTRDPHALTTGTTGAGKSVAMAAIVATSAHQIRAFLDSTQNVTDPLTGGCVLCDGKGEGDVAARLAGVRNVIIVAEEIDEIRLAVDRVFKEMLRRRKVRRAYKRKYGREPEFPPLFLDIDEWMDIVDELADLDRDNGHDPLKDFFRKTRRIAQRGRSVRVFLRVYLQRPDSSADGTDGLPGRIKRLLNLRVGLGYHDQIASRMTFDDGEIGQRVDRAPGGGTIPGRGAFRLGATAARLQFPYLPDPTALPAGSAARAHVEALLPKWTEVQRLAAWDALGDYDADDDTTLTPTERQDDHTADAETDAFAESDDLEAARAAHAQYQAELGAQNRAFPPGPRNGQTRARRRTTAFPTNDSPTTDRTA